MPKSIGSISNTDRPSIVETSLSYIRSCLKVGKCGKMTTDVYKTDGSHISYRRREKIKKSQNAVIKSSPVRDKGIRCFPGEDKWYVVRVSSQEDGGD